MEDELRRAKENLELLIMARTQELTQVSNKLIQANQELRSTFDTIPERLYASLMQWVGPDRLHSRVPVFP